MKKIYSSLSETIGNTPLLHLFNYSKSNNITAKILAKLEYFNPAGSVKDRIALSMINDAEAKGLLKKDSVIIEPTSGNTGIGLCCIAAARGYKVIIVMPDTMSIERQNLILAYGGEIVLTEGSLGMAGSIDKAIELSKLIPNAFIPSQFSNAANPLIHTLTTGPEIWRDTDGSIDILVAGVGTGGTISGVGSYLKQMNPSIKIIAVEPESSPILSGGNAGPHKIQGIGAGFIPETLNTNIYDEVIKVSNEDAFYTTKTLVKNEGLLVGFSSGAALYAATKIANKPENSRKTIVVIFPDGGERYLSLLNK